MNKAKLLGSRIWQHFVHDSLYRNSVFLILNMGFTAGAGFLFWTLNARLFSTRDVGYATALISALGLAGILSNLGFNKTIVRFLAQTEDKNRLIITKFYISIVAAVISSVALAFCMPRLGITHATGQLVAVFALSAIVLSLKNLVDSIFISYRAARYTLIENSVANVTKLALPFICISLGYMGVFFSYVVSALLAVLVGLYMLRKKFDLSFRQKPAVSSLNGLWTFSLGSYMADIVGALPTLILPLVITAKLGPVQAAYWYIAMLVASFLFMLCSSVNQSLFAEAAHDETKLLQHVRKAGFVMFGMVIPMAAILAVAAPLITSIFGHEYLAAVTPLRLLLLSSLLVAGNYVSGSILNMYRKVGYLTLVNAANALTVLGLSFFVVTSLTGFGMAWLVGEVVNIILFGAGALYVLKKDRMAKPAKTIAFDGRYFSNPGTGINLYVKALLRLLVDNGYDVTVVLYETPPESIPGLDKCKIAIVKRNRYKLDPLWEQISLPFFLYRNNFTYYVAPGNKGLALLYFGKTKTMLTVHDLIPFHYARMYFKKQPIIMMMYFPSMIISLLKANKIMAVSKATATDVRKRFGRKATPFMLPLRYMDMLDAKVPAHPKRKKQFVYNGGTDPRKNVPLLIESFAEFLKDYPGYELILMGGGYNRFEDIIATNGVQDSVHLTGYVLQDEKMRILAESAAVVYPSLMEGYGLPIVEAMMVGAPIICGTGGSQAEVAEHVGIFLEPVTKPNLVAALKQVADGNTDPNYTKTAKQQLAHLASPEWEAVILSQFND